MSLAVLDLTDIYYTPSNQILLRAKGRSLTIESIRQNPETLMPCLFDEAQKTIEQAADKKTALDKLLTEIELELSGLYERVASLKAADAAIKEGKFVYRVNRSKTVGGVNYTLRRLSAEVPTLASLGFSKNLLEHIEGLGRKQGLVLLSGSTGSGKTTSISSMLAHFLKRHGQFAFTIEDPPEYPLEGEYSGNLQFGYCIQTAVEQKSDWAEKLRDALRSRPHYILVGEVRDPECASELLRAANSGHLVFSTIHGQSIMDGLASLVKYAAPVMSEDLAHAQLAEGLAASMHQSLAGGRLAVNALFAGDRSSSVRNKILNGEINMLTSDIEQQAIRIERGMALFR